MEQALLARQVYACRCQRRLLAPCRPSRYGSRIASRALREVPHVALGGLQYTKHRLWRKNQDCYNQDGHEESRLGDRMSRNSTWSTRISTHSWTLDCTIPCNAPPSSSIVSGEGFWLQRKREFNMKRPAQPSQLEIVPLKILSAKTIVAPRHIGSPFRLCLRHWITGSTSSQCSFKLWQGVQTMPVVCSCSVGWWHLNRCCASNNGYEVEGRLVRDRVGSKAMLRVLYIGARHGCEPSCDSAGRPTRGNSLVTSAYVFGAFQGTPPPV